MNFLGVVFGELIGRFVYDGLLALEIVAIAVFAGIVAALFPDSPLATGGILPFGCVEALLAGVLKSSRR